MCVVSRPKPLAAAHHSNEAMSEYYHKTVEGEVKANHRSDCLGVSSDQKLWKLIKHPDNTVKTLASLFHHNCSTADKAHIRPKCDQCVK